MANLVFYDFETCSSNVSYGQIIQAAAVLVNDNFQELDRYEGRCKLNPGIIPECMSLLVNKICFPTSFARIGITELTPVVFCTVTAVIAVMA